MIRRNDFTYSSQAEPHRARTKEILQHHPEIFKLIGKNPWTFFAILGLVGFQITSTFLISFQPWWLIILLAYMLGAYVDHALYVMIHECTHNLLFNKRSSNRIASLIANLPILIPSAMSFERYHLKHHAFQGVYVLDADLPSRWEARLINSYFMMKIIWFLLYPLFQSLRVLRLQEIKFFDKWLLANWIVQFVFIMIMCLLVGQKGMVYLSLSFMFSIGLHPLGARWIQEHYLTFDKEQETYSYYGMLNWVAFNVGYHNEHHDLPFVPWNKLPLVKKMLPNFYNSLKSYTSWTKLFFRFLFDREISLFSRMIRNNRNDTAKKVFYGMK